MNKPELESILKQARLPEIPEASLEIFPRNVVSRIDRERASWSSSFSLSGRGDAAGNTLKRELQRLFPRLAWGLATATCILLTFAVVHWNGRIKSETIPANDSLASLKLIRETLALFPNRVRAIVQDEHGLNLVLSENDDVPASAPLYVRICDGSNCSSAVTFSGQEIELAGQKISVLADARGEIILSGNQFVWSETAPAHAGSRLKIEAKNLGAVAM